MLRQVARRLQQFADEAVQPLDLAIVRIEPGLNEAPGRHLPAPASPPRIGKPRGHILAETERLADLANRAARAVLNDGRRTPGAPAPIAVVEVLEPLPAPPLLDTDSIDGVILAPAPPKSPKN